MWTSVQISLISVIKTVFSASCLQSHMIFRNHHNMLLEKQFWLLSMMKTVTLLTFLWKHEIKYVFKIDLYSFPTFNQSCTRKTNLILKCNNITVYSVFDQINAAVESSRDFFQKLIINNNNNNDNRPVMYGLKRNCHLLRHDSKWIFCHLCDVIYAIITVISTIKNEH